MSWGSVTRRRVSSKRSFRMRSVISYSVHILMIKSVLTFKTSIAGVRSSKTERLCLTSPVGFFKSSAMHLSLVGGPLTWRNWSSRSSNWLSMLFKLLSLSLLYLASTSERMRNSSIGLRRPRIGSKSTWIGLSVVAVRLHVLVHLTRIIMVSDLVSTSKILIFAMSFKLNCEGPWMASR